MPHTSVYSSAAALLKHHFHREPCKNVIINKYFGKISKIMTIDGIYTNNQHLKDLAYPNQTKEVDYTFAHRVH